MWFALRHLRPHLRLNGRLQGVAWGDNLLNKSEPSFDNKGCMLGAPGAWRKHRSITDWWDQVHRFQRATDSAGTVHRGDLRCIACCRLGAWNGLGQIGLASCPGMQPQLTQWP